MRASAIALAAVLAGCSGIEGYQSKLLTDNAILTLPVPNPQTDCQHRVTQAQFQGGGLMAEGGFTSTITTVIGPQNCPEGMGVVVPTLQRLSLPPEAEAKLRAVCARVPDAPECQ